MDQYIKEEYERLDKEKQKKNATFQILQESLLEKQAKLEKERLRN